jgi:RNA polymerase sigma-70 factor (ECF subfamily)
MSTPPIDPKSDIALMAKVRLGKVDAFETLHERYQHRLLNFFYGLSHDSHIANDLCQETFLRVWKIRKRYRATGSVVSYFFGIARMVWHEKRRALAKTGRLGVQLDFDVLEEVLAHDGGTPDFLAKRAEVEARIHAALEELPEEQRLVFLLRTVEGMSLRDIATSLDCPLNTVRSRKILAVKKLRYLLEKVYPTPVDRIL